jgi:hypothetical protein
MTLHYQMFLYMPVIGCAPHVWNPAETKGPGAAVESASNVHHLAPLPSCVVQALREEIVDHLLIQQRTAKDCLCVSQGFP